MFLTLTIVSLVSSALAQSSAVNTSILWPVAGSPPEINHPLNYTGIYEASVITTISETTVFQLACPASPDTAPPSTSVNYGLPYSTISSGGSAQFTESASYLSVPSPLPCSLAWGPMFTVTVAPSTFELVATGTTTQTFTFTDANINHTSSSQQVNTDFYSLSVNCSVGGTTMGAPATCSTSAHDTLFYAVTTLTDTSVAGGPTNSVSSGQITFQTIMVTAGAEKLKSGATKGVGPGAPIAVAMVVVSVVFGGLLVVS